MPELLEPFRELVHELSDCASCCLHCVGESVEQGSGGRWADLDRELCVLRFWWRLVREWIASRLIRNYELLAFLVVLDAHVAVEYIWIRFLGGFLAVPWHICREIFRAWYRLRREGRRVFQEIAAAFVVPENTGLQFCDRHVLAEVPAVVAVHHDSVRILFQNFGGSAQILQLEGVGVLVEPDAFSVPASASFPYNYPRYTVADFFGVLPSYFV